MEPSHSIVPWRYRPGPDIPSTLQARPRSYMVGSAAVDDYESAWGRSSDTFAPAEYGNYAATSDLIYSAGNIRARNLGKLPIKAWKRRRDGRLTEVTNPRPGSMVDLLDRVNPFWPAKRLVRMIEWDRFLWGQAFVVLNRGASGGGTPTEMWRVRPDRMRVMPHATDYIGGFIYEQHGKRIPFLPSEVLWFPMDNPIDEFAGLSPIASARISVDTANAAQRANRNIFLNGLMAGGVISPDDKDEIWSKDDVDLISGLLRKRAQGDENAHRWIVLGRMLKLQESNFSPEEMQYLDQLRWSVATVARVSGVPAGLLQDREHSTYNNLDSDHRFLWNETLAPEADDIADVLTEFLCPMFPGEADVVTLDYSGVPALQEDQEALTAQAQTWFTMGVPLNDVLEKYNPSLLPEGGYEWGDEQGGTAATPVATPDVPGSSGPENPPATNSITDTLVMIRQLRETTHQRIEFGSVEHDLKWRRATKVMDRGERAFKRELLDLFRRQEASVLARLRKRREMGAALTRDDDSAAAAPFDIAQWTDAFVQSILPVLSEIMADSGGETLSDLGIAGDFDLTNPLVRQWLDQAVFTFAQEVNATTIEALRQVLQDGIDQGLSTDELADQVKSVFGDIADTRADLITRTEVTEAVNAGSLEGARQSGVVTSKTWLAALDNRTRETHSAAHGQTVGLDEMFDVGGSQLQFPGDGGNGADVSELANCRCSITYEVSTD